MSELDAFESWAGHFRARLEALARRAALHDIARELRRSQQAPYLRTETEATGVAIGFAGRIARVARTHQLGERVRVALGGPGYKYPARVLPGCSDEDGEMIRNMLLAHNVKSPFRRNGAVPRHSGASVPH
jgi:hypothetical protein